MFGSLVFLWLRSRLHVIMPAIVIKVGMRTHGSAQAGIHYLLQIRDVKAYTLKL